MHEFREFAFKPGALAAELRFRIDDHRIEQCDATGAVRARIDLSTLQRVRWNVVYGKPLMFYGLELKGADGTMLIGKSVIALTRPDHPALAPYLATVKAVLLTLGKVRPDMGVHGPPAAVGWFLFSMALALAGFFGYLAVQVHAHPRALWLTTFMGGVGVFCLYGAWYIQPWRGSLVTPFHELAESLEDWHQRQ